MAIIGIVALDRQGAIGKEGKLPWHFKADLRFFREQTTGHACVMGYRTWLSLREVPLPKRLNLVLSRRAHITRLPPVIFLTQELTAIELNDYLQCDLFVIGGASIYEAFREHIECWIVTEIPLTIEDADTFMPADFLEGFTRTATRNLGDDLTVNFYERG
ncbi:MAG: dihydrofolate reductase [Pyrinomonadaceae bacterium MAG19_C2-C3]|nr:dihydrofolate reductase [Pyrinomonadaceae bacterium MAG19_C2-C3]